MDFEEFFQLNQRPFKPTPEAQFFFRRQAFDEMAGILSGSLGALPLVLFLRGPEGVGKSTFIRRLPQAIRETTKMAPIFNSSLQLGQILSDTLNFLGLGTKCPPSAKEESLLGFFQNAINQFLESNFRLVLAVDDAHCLSEETLSDLLALIQLESSWANKTTLMLAGPDHTGWPGQQLPPEALLVELPPMGLDETHSYLRHRLSAAGALREHFTLDAITAIEIHSGGLPAKINPLADRAMMLAWSDGRKQVTGNDINQAKNCLDRPFTVNPAAAARASTRTRRHRSRIGGRAWISLAGALIVIGSVLLTAWARQPNPSNDVLPNVQEVAEEEPALPAATATPAASPDLAAQGSLALPTPPPSLLNLPHNSLALVIDHSQKLARLWQGGLVGAGLKAEIAVQDFWEPGLYLVGRPRKLNPLIFQYPPTKEMPKSAGEKLWQQVESLLPQDLLPLMVGAGPALARTVPPDLASHLAQTVNKWTKAQEYKLAGEMAGLYAENFQYFEPGHKPLSINRRNFKAALDSESNVAGDVTLAVSDPLIMLDPSYPERAWAVFNLRYNSKIRHDMGLRALIFEKDNSSSQWLIVAELWLKQDTLKN
ncbi:MAG: AAA family ATPase [Deltaproteobacteria bacterium]|jgi:type II secretory pathway predicted ATPase ExeA|nr:AAA family ATPase [Deltaproteobacteria bacterium]